MPNSLTEKQLNDNLYKDDEEEEKTTMDLILDWLSMPYVLIFTWTMPDCHYEFEDDEDEEFDKAVAACGSAEEKKKVYQDAFDELTCPQKWFWATFCISLVHITWLSYFMVEFMLKLGCLWGIPDVVMG